MALLDAVEAAGFHQECVSIIDKGQRSQKGYKVRRGELVPFYDLVLTFTAATETKEVRRGDATAVALSAVEDHLDGLGLGGVPKHRGIDYLYSLAVAEVIRKGLRPEGLSLRAFERLCDSAFGRRDGSYFRVLG